MTEKKAPQFIQRYRRLMTQKDFSGAIDLLADEFEKKTGIMAPGKDVPAALAMDSGMDRDEQQSLFNVWMEQEVQPWM